jgi:Tfp pilus assembly protein PilO
MNSKKIKRFIIVFSFINIVLFGMYGYLFYVVNDKNKETAVLYAASHQQAADKEKIQGLERTLKDTAKDRDSISKYFVSKTNAVTFIEQIEKVGKSANVVLSVNTVSDDAKDMGGIQLSFSATGGFSDIYRLIALVESLPYKVTLKKTDIQKTEERKEGVAVWKGNFTVMLESFTQPNTTTTPAEISSGAAKK